MSSSRSNGLSEVGIAPAMPQPFLQGSQGLFRRFDQEDWDADRGQEFALRSTFQLLALLPPNSRATLLPSH